MSAKKLDDLYLDKTITRIVPEDMHDNFHAATLRVRTSKSSARKISAQGLSKQEILNKKLNKVSAFKSIKLSFKSNWIPAILETSSS